MKAFINKSQMTVSQMSITETTPSPQHKLHWLAEHALNWSGLPVVHVRPTVLLEGFFLILTRESGNQIRSDCRSAMARLRRSEWKTLHVLSPCCSPIRSRISARPIT